MRLEVKTPEGRRAFYAENVMYFEEVINDSDPINCIICLVKDGICTTINTSESYEAVMDKMNVNNSNEFYRAWQGYKKKSEDMLQRSMKDSSIDQDRYTHTVYSMGTFYYKGNVYYTGTGHVVE